MIAKTRNHDQQALDFDWSPEKWREVGKRVLDLAVETSTGWEQRRPAPSDAGESLKLFGGGLPEGPMDVDELLEIVERDLIPGAAFNGHPSWFAYITGASLPVSVIGDLLESALNQNVALWRLSPAATAIELQTIDWIKEMVGFPATAEGIFVSGGQMANIVAHTVLRDVKTPWDTRRFGMRGPTGDAPKLRIYASAETHYCHPQAAELLGLGHEAVRLVPTDARYMMRVDALRAMIAEDRANGDIPIAVIGTAGTVGTGAVDPLVALKVVAHNEGLWFHVDGAYGAFAALARSHPPELDGMALADSIACDPHKWLYSPIDAGVILIREPGLLEKSFSFHPSYLATDSAPNKVDLLERSPENTRPFRAFKVWLAIRLYGRDGYSDMIESNIRLAEYLEQLVRETPGLSLAAPRQLSIVCWRVDPPGMNDPDQLDQLQLSVIRELESRGIAMVSNTRLSDGRSAIRACIVNFRTTAADVEALVETSASIGKELAGSN